MDLGIQFWLLGCRDMSSPVCLQMTGDTNSETETDSKFKTFNPNKIHLNKCDGNNHTALCILNVLNDLLWILRDFICLALAILPIEVIKVESKWKLGRWDILLKCLQRQSNYIQRALSGKIFFYFQVKFDKLHPLEFSVVNIQEQFWDQKCCFLHVY